MPRTERASIKNVALPTEVQHIIQSQTRSVRSGNHADAVRETLDRASAEQLENYGFCNFSNKGTKRFLARDGAKPALKHACASFAKQPTGRVPTVAANGCADSPLPQTPALI